MDSASGKPFEKGKREAEDAVETEAACAKKPRVEEKVSKIKADRIEGEEEAEADASCSKPEVRVSAEGGLLVSVLEEKCNAFEEDKCAAEKKPVVTAEGDIAAASYNDSDSFFQDETSLDQDAAATIRALAPLIEEETVAPPKKKDESNMDSECCSKDETFFSEDVTGANLSPQVLSVPISFSSVQNEDDSRIDEFGPAHNTDDNVATANKAPAAFPEKGRVVAWEKKDESGSDNEMFDEVTAESIPSVFTKNEDKNNDELELDNETSSSDDNDAQTSAIPTDQATGDKTLFVGNLSYSVEQEDVYGSCPKILGCPCENFFKAAGEVVNIRFGMNSDETFKGYGHVEFASAEAAEKAFRELNGKELLRRRVRLDFANGRRGFTPYSGCPDTDSIQKEGKTQWFTVFIRGLNKADGQDEIRRSLEEHFGICGEISRVSVPKDQDGCARGIAYIDFKDRDALTRALAFNGSEFREGILSVQEAMSRIDSRDIAGNGRGYGRNGGRYSWRDLSGRTGWCHFGGRSGGRDFPGRGVCVAGGGRTGWQDFSGRRGVCEAGGGRSGWQEFSGRRGDWQDFSGRRGVHEAGVGRGYWRDFSGRRGDWQDFSERRGVQEAGVGRGNWRDLSGRRGVQEAGGGRGDWRDLSGRRGVHEGGGGRGDWQDLSGRRGGWQGMSGRRGGAGETGNWFGGGAWQDSSRRGGLDNYFNGRPDSGVWLGGGGWGQATPTKPCVAAPGDGNNEDHVEDQMK